jgi:hypothetical protein
MLCIVEELREKDTLLVASRVLIPGFTRAGSLFNKHSLKRVASCFLPRLHGYRLHLTQDYTAYRFVGSLLLLH